MRVVGYISPGGLLCLALLVLGVFWCKEVIGRWRSDVEELRASEDKVRKAVIIGIWVVTFFIAMYIVSIAAALIWRILLGIHGFWKLMSS